MKIKKLDFIDKTIYMTTERLTMNSKQKRREFEVNEEDDDTKVDQRVWC